jgi:oligopeptide/dipeptide ABC transporter ATP-binding protein
MPILEIEGLNVCYRPERGVRISAVRDLDISLERGEFVGIVGESGSGKSTLGFAITRMLRPPAVIESGAVKFKGTNILELTGSELRNQRRGGLALVLQSGMNALNPVRSISKQLGDVLKAHSQKGEHWGRSEVRARGGELLSMVELDSEVLDRYPHELSGGMRQRVAIALALSLEPELVVFDEPTTALDVIVQASVMETIKSLQRSRGFTAILISHDMSVVLDATDRTLVMYAGRVVEDQPSKTVASVGIHHPYTEALMKCYADPRADKVELQDIGGTPPDLSIEVAGCSFAPRCSFASEVCFLETPSLVRSELIQVACHVRLPVSPMAKEVKVVRN